MQENKTLSLVLPENWHFLRGDMRGWGFKCKLSNSLPSTTIQLVDFATKYLRTTVHSVVEIYDFLLGPEEEIAILVKIYFSLNNTVRFASLL